MPAPRILIIGFGLMGGSAGLALRARGWHVAYIDEHVPHARAAAAADEKLDAPRGDEDLVLLATHLPAALEWLPRIRTGGAITSLTSVMRPLRAIAPPNFIAGHPIAGSHRSGIEAATAELYRDRPWFLDARDAMVERMVHDCGAIARFTTAEEHDAAVALTSHLPQIVSTALAACLAQHDVLDYAGPGLRDVLRLAASGEAMWRPILDANRDHLEDHTRALNELIRAIANGEAPDAFRDANELARKLRNRDG